MATSKIILEENFSDTRRPSGDQFKELINAFIHKNDKVIALPVDDAADANPPEEINKGNIRWNGTAFQFWDGAVWTSLGGGSDLSDIIEKEDGDVTIKSEGEVLFKNRGSKILVFTTFSDKPLIKAFNNELIILGLDENFTLKIKGNLEVTKDLTVNGTINP